MLTTIHGKVQGNTVVLDDNISSYDGQDVFVTILDLNTFRQGDAAVNSNDTEKPDVSKRIGIAKGFITDPEDFDAWDEEIADLFYGEKNS